MGARSSTLNANRLRNFIFAVAFFLSPCLSAAAAPEKSDPDLIRAKRYIETGDINKALALIGNRGDVAALLTLGEIAVEFEMTECSSGGWNYVGRAYEVAPTNPKAMALRAIMLARQRKYPQAVEMAKRAVLSDPKSFTAHAALGRLLNEEGHPEEGLSEMLKAQQLGPKEIMPKAYLSSYYTAKLDTAEAEKYCKSIVSQHPELPIAHLISAEFYMFFHRDAEASKEFNIAIEANKQFQLSYILRARAYLTRENSRAAMSCIEAVTPEMHIPLINDVFLRVRSDCETRLGKTKAAVQDFDAIAKAHGKVDTVKSNKNNFLHKADIYYGAKNYPQTLELTKQVLAVYPDNLHALYLQANCLRAMNQNENALAAYNKLITKEQSMPDWYRERGQLLLKLGKTDEADKDFARAKFLE